MWATWILSGHGLNSLEACMGQHRWGHHENCTMWGPYCIPNLTLMGPTWTWPNGYLKVLFYRLYMFYQKIFVLPLIGVFVFINY